MRITSIAVANLRRRKAKAMFLVTGIGIGIGTVVAILSLSGSIRQEIGSQLDRFGANIVVLPNSHSLSLDYGGISVSGVSFDAHQLTNEDAAKILNIPYRKRLSVVAPKLLTAADVEGRQALLAGVQFQNELRLKRWWRIHGQAPKTAAEVLMGYETARLLHIIEPSAAASIRPAATGGSHHENSGPTVFTLRTDRVRISGQEHRIAGVIEPTGGPEDRMVFADLEHVQELAGKPDQISLIEVSALCKDCPVEDIVAQIGRELPHARASAIQQSVRARTETVDRLTRFSTAISAVVLAIGGLMIFTTMMGSVVERTKEIGVLRALGFRRTHVIQELLTEVAAISAVGGILGWAAGMLAAWAALPHFTEAGTPLEVRSTLAAFAVAAALALGLLASIYPALRAARLDPAESVRYV